MRNKKYAIRSEFDLRGLLEIAERFPFLFEDFRLNVKIGGTCWRAANSQIECDAEGRLGHRGEPAGEYVVAVFCRSSGRAHANVVRANRDVLRRLCEFLRYAEHTTPI